MSTANTRWSSQLHGCRDGSAAFFEAPFADDVGSSASSNSGSCAGGSAGFFGTTSARHDECPASTDFRLDAYEVTVGRFRQFVAAVAAGFRPTPGAGRHAHINGGDGLRDLGPPGGLERGWQADWTIAYLPTTKAAWDAALDCDMDLTFSTWTADPGANERLAVNCVDWYAAQAFCIWDGGFLPSEAEWNYAASGGSEQRVYPWSSPPDSALFDVTYAVHAAPGVSAVGSTPLGLGRYGQFDLAGNLNEWTLDESVIPYAAGSCVDCAHLYPAYESIIVRGGDFSSSSATALLASAREDQYARGRSITNGVRCARAP